MNLPLYVNKIHHIQRGTYRRLKKLVCNKPHNSYSSPNVISNYDDRLERKEVGGAF
jgi:hypothetical protein